MLRQIAYQFGRAFGALPMFARVLVVVCFGGGVGYYSTQPSAVERREQNAAALKRLADAQATKNAASELERVRSDCQKSIDAKKKDYLSLLAARKFWDASLVLRQCATTLADASLLKLVADAEIQSHLQSVNDTKAPPRDRAQSIELLTRNYPEIGKPFAQLQTQLLAKADQTARAQEAGRRRKKGVSIGMTQEEVLASSWGKPESVNRTTYSFGVHEQWVYGGQNYLYFENGQLMSIQN